jgi:anti-sigma regulatory factor (Ser/Thr protein kinase)
MHRFSTGPYSVLAAEDPGPARPDTGWLLRSELVFGALPGAVPCARLHARLVLFEWGQGGLADSVELVVSELMTNALRAAAPASRGWAGSQGILAGPSGGLPPIGFRMASDERQVLVEVWDGNPAPPLQGAGPVSEDSESGRGLLMVQQVSRQWGYYYPAAEPGQAGPGEFPVKVVWALVAAVR